MKKSWTSQHIKEGFERFIKVNKRLPTANEIDTLSYLPSSRYIQKRFGGLAFLRKELGYNDIHFGKGVFRSNIAKEGLIRSNELTETLQESLYILFGIDCVETEKTFLGKYRVNFYIHTENYDFGVDIFYAENMRTLQSSVNIKMKKYKYFSDTLFMVVANESFRQAELDIYTRRKQLPFPTHVHLVTLDTLYTQLRKKTSKWHNPSKPS